MMADIYLRSSDGDNGDDGSTWALAKATLAGAITAAGAGGRVFMSDNHSETGASSIVGGTVSAPIQILSVDDSGDPEPPTSLLAGGIISTTGSTDITMNGYLYFHGVAITSGDWMQMITADSKLTFEECVITSPDQWRIGSSDEDMVIHMINTNIDMGGTNNEIYVSFGAKFIWEGGALINTAPTTLFDTHTRSSSVVIRDVDLSTLSGNLINPTGTTGFFEVLLERCKLHASLTVLQNAIVGAGSYRVRLHSCDTDGDTYEFHEEYYEGTNTTSITEYRTGGASDGTDGQSIQMTTNTNAIEVIQPLVSPPIVHWTDSTSSTTFTVEFLHDSATALQKDEVWMELEYPGTTSSTWSIATTKIDVLTTPTDTDSSAEVWTETLTNENERKLSVTVTPNRAGPVTARVYLGKASTTAYIDPVITES